MCVARRADVTDPVSAKETGNDTAPCRSVRRRVSVGGVLERNRRQPRHRVRPASRERSPRARRKRGARAQCFCSYCAVTPIGWSAERGTHCPAKAACQMQADGIAIRVRDADGRGQGTEASRRRRAWRSYASAGTCLNAGYQPGFGGPLLRQATTKRRTMKTRNGSDLGARPSAPRKTGRARSRLDNCGLRASCGLGIKKGSANRHMPEHIKIGVRERDVRRSFGSAPIHRLRGVREQGGLDRSCRVPTDVESHKCRGGCRRRCV